MSDFLLWVDLSYISQSIVPIINTTVFTVSAVIALFSCRAALKNLANTRLMHVYVRVMEHNKQIFDDNFKKVAVNIFLGIEDDDQRSMREKFESEGKTFELYWAARAVHLSHINLIAQAWILSGKSERRLERKFPGWIDLAKKLSKELTEATFRDEGKPLWYRKACRDLSPISKNFIYGKKFFQMMENLQNRR